MFCVADYVRDQLTSMVVSEYQSVECAITSPVSIESGMLVTCRMHYAMYVVSLGGKYVFAIVMCILTSCSSVC